MRNLALALMGLIVLTFASCSFRQTGYRYADWYLESRLNKYLKINAQQKPKVELLVDSALNDVSKTVLPSIASDLDQLANRIKDGSLSELDAHWIMERYEELISSLLLQTADELGSLLSMLSDDQINHLKNRLAEDMQDREKKLQLSDEDFRKEEFKNFQKRFGTFYGRMTPEQETQVANILDMNKERARERFAISKEMHKTFVDFLLTKPNQADIEKQVMLWAKDRSSLISNTEVRKAFKDRNAAMSAKMLALASVMTTEQRANVLKEVHAMSSDLMEMSKRTF